MNTRRATAVQGIATIEFALVAPLVLLLLAAVLDFALVLRMSTCAANAARIGAEYGSRGTAFSADYAGMQNAAVHSAPGVTGMVASPARSCQCSGGGAVSCSGTCSGGKMMYVQVTVTVPIHSIFNYSLLNVPASVAARASMRVQ